MPYFEYFSTQFTCSMRRFSCIVGVLLFGMTWGQAQMPKGEIKATLRMLQAAPTFLAVIDSLSLHDHFPDSTTLSVVREALWQRLLEDDVRFPESKRAFEEGKCEYAPNKTGLFSLKVKGARPDHGYPVYIGLHGGGGGPKEMNDEQWDQMQKYYLSSIDTGIYIAPRGPNNTWNLHFDDDAQAFYNRLLGEVRRYAGADPDRIYLMGYSAGGDGVYQLAPRLAPQLAAADMSAGHHNGISPVNLEHLPMLLQVGELDDAYDRNKETVSYGMLLDSLAKRFPGEYVHQVYVHAGAQHSYVRDRQGAQAVGQVLQNPIKWLQTGVPGKSVVAMTDAPTWVSKFVRNPYPQQLRWDAATRLASNEDWYWISVGQADAAQVIEVWASPATNALRIAPFTGELRIHLHEALFDPSKPIVVSIDGQTLTLHPHPSMLEMAKTMLQTVDPAYASWQTVRVWRDAKGKYIAE